MTQMQPDVLQHLEDLPEQKDDKKSEVSLDEICYSMSYESRVNSEDRVVAMHWSIS